MTSIDGDADVTQALLRAKVLEDELRANANLVSKLTDRLRDAEAREAEALSAVAHALAPHHCDPCLRGEHGRCDNTGGCKGCCPACHAPPWGAVLVRLAVRAEGGEVA